MRQIVLLSGGLDSAYSWHRYANRDALPVFLLTGAVYSRRDFTKAMAQSRGEMETLDVSHILRNDGTEVPGRNALMILAVAARYAKAGDEIVVSFAEGDAMLDTSREFVRSMDDLLMYTSGVSVVNGCRGKTKSDMLRELPLSVVRNTRSCYGPDEIPCGACTACARLYLAAVYADREGWVTYQRPPLMFIRDRAKDMRPGVALQYALHYPRAAWQTARAIGMLKQRGDL